MSCFSSSSSSSSGSSAVGSSSASPVAFAACCLPTGACVHVTANTQGELTCQLMGGTYKANKHCYAGLCYAPPSSSSSSPRGNLVACCAGSGAGCVPVPYTYDGWYECEVNMGGKIFPSNTCADSICSSPSAEPLAACCLPNGDCISVLNGPEGEYICAVLGGDYNSSLNCQATNACPRQHYRNGRLLFEC